MKRTLLVTLDYPPMLGGVANYYKNIVEQLPADSIFVLDNDKDELLSNSRLLWPRWIRGVLNTRRAVKQYEIERLLVGQLLPIGTIALILKKWMKLPYGVMTHAMDVTLPFGPQGSTRKQWLVKKILKNADFVTTVSSYTRKKLQNLGVPPSRIIVVYPCPNIDGSSSAVSSGQLAQLDQQYTLQNQRVLLSVGRLVERKGIDTVIQAFAALKEKHENVHYVIIGSGSDRERLRQLAATHGVPDRVHFVGSVTDDELAVWYARCEALIMPSRQLGNNDVEGFGMVFLEANSFGKPVIGGRSGGIADAVIDGQTGFLVDPSDVDMVTRSIDRLLSNESEAIRLGYQGSERVKEVFQWPVQAKQIEEALTI